MAVLILKIARSIASEEPPEGLYQKLKPTSLENMLTTMVKAFAGRNIEQALQVLRTDSEVDRLRNLIVVRHTENAEGLKGPESLHVLSMANSLERAGDHIKNMAEELCHLATGHTIRHLIRSKNKPIEQMFLQWLAKQNPPR